MPISRKWNKKMVSKQKVYNLNKAKRRNNAGNANENCDDRGEQYGQSYSQCLRASLPCVCLGLDRYHFKAEFQELF